MKDKVFHMKRETLTLYLICSILLIMKKKKTGQKKSYKNSAAAKSAAFVRKRRPAAGSGEILTGVLEKHPKGFGFVRQEEGGDIFVGRDNMLGAMNGDLVEVDLDSFQIGHHNQNFRAQNLRGRRHFPEKPQIRIRYCG